MPTLSGTGEPGTIITLYNNGVNWLPSRSIPQGSWTYPLTRNLSEGLNILTATAGCRRQPAAHLQRFLRYP